MSTLQTIGDALLAACARVSFTLSRERGQALAEYGLIITIIAVAVVVLSMLTFREALVGAFNSAITCLDGLC